MPIDIAGLALGFAGTVLPFWASGELRSHGFASAVVAIPLAIGLACFLALMLVEYHKEEALSPVAKMWTTFPVVGTLVAMAGGAAFVSFVELTANYLLKVAGVSQLAAGLAFWPQLVGALIAAAALGFVFHTRFLPVQALAGMVLLVVAGAILMVYTADGDTVKLWMAVGLLGLGAGATVSPGLFLAGQSLPSKIIGRIFALIELVRSVADFIMAPVLLRIAKVASGQHRIAATGIHDAIWITLLIALGATFLGIVLYILGGSRLQIPKLEDWIKGGRPALQSPLLLQILRQRRPERPARPQ
jgi:hypothetical protein